ncbi:low-density lipoprotein receptor-like [Macrobrachium nipponense]|uniref:low-density lipoprotein receptor-like n=1 Tax=Macrobrachium nipponense TaxID=159736 RepID=UPI0030C7D715
MTAKRKMKILLVLISASAAVVNCHIQCSDNEWSCDRSRCIPKRWLCDGDPDCTDGTDEKAENCPGASVKHPVKECSSREFKCDNGNCIPKTWQCDGADDCKDNSDESSCSRECTEKEFQCVSTRQCIAIRWRCDGTGDCEDGSDEEGCAVETTPLPSTKFKCGSGITIPNKWLCDGESDCVDGSDEKNCESGGPQGSAEASASAVTASPRPSICRGNEFQCGSYCIMKTWVCDGTQDCANGEDEANCETCPANHFQCANKRKCIPQHQRCNALKDCDDGSDEVGCSNLSAGAAKCNITIHYPCKRGKCVDLKLLCDSKNDCGDWEDESEEVCGKNECERNNGGCTQVCVNTREGHYCSCNSGYRLVGRYTCEDINECEEIPGTCSQKCINTDGSYHCTCLPGYKRDPGNYTRCKAATGEPYLLFSHRYDIRSLRLKDRDMTSIITDARGATALDYKFSTHQIVWSNNKENEIVRANLTTPDNREVLVRGERVSADGLAVDWIHDNIYYTDTGNFKIRMVTWDAEWTKTVVSEDLGQPRAIVVSPFDGYIFWTDWGSDPKIERAGLDGAGRLPIVREPHVFWPNGITMDHSSNHIYWCDGKLNTISRANLDGSHVEVILFSPSFLRLPYSITVFEDRLYWTDWSQLALYSADKFTGEDVKSISAGHLLESPKVVHVYHEHRQPSGENVCEAHGCSHFCIRTPAGAPLCTCPDGMIMSLRDSRRCLDNEAEDEDFYINQNGNPRSNTDAEIVDDTYVPTKSERSKVSQLSGTHLGMILGGAIGSTIVVVSVVIFISWWKTRREIKHIRFQNPSYNKTRDEEMDGGGLVLNKNDLPYNPTDFHYATEPNMCTREDDEAPLTPGHKVGSKSSK